MSNENNTPATAPAVPAARRKPALLAVAAATLVGGLAYGAYWAIALRHHESTDNAYVQAPVVQITPQVGGTVLAVLAQRRQGVDLAARALDTQVGLARALGGGWHAA